MITNTQPIVGTGGDDPIQGTAGADLMLGAAGNDALLGLAGDDWLVGGVGDDKLDGGLGSDTLAGGHGADLFVFSYDDVIASLPSGGGTEVQIRLNLGHDVVLDFQVGVDHLQALAGSTPVTLSQLSQVLTLTQVDADADGTLDTVINIDYVDPTSGTHFTDPSSSITLLGVSGATVEELFAG